MINHDRANKQWFVIHTKPFQEGIAEENLKRQGYEVYYPRIKQKCRRRNRWISIIGPLFPRYMFVSVKQGKVDFSSIRSTYGVSDLVRFGGIPKAVSNVLITTIKAREDREQGLHIVQKNWQRGMKIEITEGPFAGLNGVIQAKSTEERVSILLRLLGRDNCIYFDYSAIVSV